MRFGDWVEILKKQEALRLCSIVAVNIKSAVTGEDEGAVISECERGENSAVKSYEEALKNNLPADVQTIVERQFLQVKEAHTNGKRDRASRRRYGHTAGRLMVKATLYNGTDISGRYTYGRTHWNEALNK